MTDNGDGTYSADYVLSQTGTVTVSVELMSEGGDGAYVEYFDNRLLSGSPVLAQKEEQSLDFQWGTGLVTPTQQDNISARWYFKLIAPYSETFTFYIDHDATIRFFIDGQNIFEYWLYNGTQLSQFSFNLVANQIYNIMLEWSDGTQESHLKVEWSSPNVPREVIPKSELLSPERVKGVPSIPGKSIVVTFSTTSIAGMMYEMTMQSRDSSGIAINTKSDVYSVTFTRSDSGGSQIFSTTAIYQSAGLYKASLTPTIAGKYTVTVNMTNAFRKFNPSLPTEIIGSPFTVDVDSDHKLNSIETFQTAHIAGALYTMTIQSRDALNNPLYSTFDVYSAKLTRFDGGGSQQYTTTAVYQSAGLYKVELTPTIAGKYTMTVNVANIYTDSHPSASTEIVKSPFPVTVDSDPGKSKIKTFTTTHIAAEIYTMTIQSLDANNIILDSLFDDYTVQFTRSDGGGSEQYTTTAVYQSVGLYKAELTPTVAGKYTVRVNIFNDYTHSNPSLLTEIIGSPFTVTVDSDPGKSEIKTFATTHIAGDPYQMTIESRDALNNILYSAFDVYSAKLTRSDGGGSQQYTATAVYQSAGLYKVELTPTPTIAGEYTMKVNIDNAYTASHTSTSTEIIGSPFPVTVYPAKVNSALCYSDVPSPSIPEQTANFAFNYKIKFVDSYGNLHYQTMTDDNLLVAVNAAYENHNEWPSPIGVADLTDWQTFYGTSISGTAIDNNDGSMTGSVIIKRAGAYTLSITVDGVHIKNSPHFPFKVKPASLHAPTCVPVGIAETMYAGFDYSFQIQGRDEYHNNIANYLANAVGTDYRIVYSLVADSSVSVDAQISDDSSPGVYIVKVSLPKKLKAGEYDLKILLKGAKTPSPAILVKPCTNTIAFTKQLGNLRGAGNTIWLNALNYTLSSPQESIELPVVEIYCEQELTQILKSAKATYTDGSKKELNQAQLKTYGITLPPNGETPLLKVFSEDETLGGITFDLHISATVVEEQTWADTTIIKILYKKPLHRDPFQYPLPDEAPRFEDKETFKKTLKFRTDEKKAQFFTPTVMSCWLAESHSLPPIVGEAKGEKFTVRVTLATASAFLSYDPKSKTFEVKSGLGYLKENAYVVKIEVTNQYSLSSFYDWRIFYSCQLQEKVVEPSDSYKYRYDENPPVPYIYKINRYGEVKIRFSAEMEPKASLKETEIYSPERRLLKESTIGDVFGLSTSTFTNFTLIHNSTVQINGTTYPSLSVAIRPLDPEDTCARQLDFIWRCIDYTRQELTLQLDFTTPSCVSSSSNVGDQIVVTFWDQRLFADITQKLVWPETVIKEQIMRQISSQEKNKMKALTDSAAAAIITTSSFGVLLNSCVLKLGINKIINTLKRLQIIIYIFLIQVYLVAHAEEFIETLLKIIAFQLYDLSGIFKKIFDVEESQPIDVRFQSLGYETSDSILNLGPVFASILLIPVLITLVFILSRCCCWTRLKNFFRNLLDKIFFNSLIQFVGSTALTVAVCCSINIYQVYKGVANKNGSYYFALSAFSTLTFYIVTLIVYLHYKFGQLQTEQQSNRVGAAYTHLAVEKKGRLVLGFLFFSFGRSIAVAFLITYGIQSFVLQLLFINFSSNLLLSFVGIFRPFESSLENRLDMLNEFTILVICCHLITQTDFVLEIAGRDAMGWSLICVIIFNIFVNLSCVLVLGVRALCRKLKLYYLKRIYIQKVRLWREKKQQIIERRQMYLQIQLLERRNFLGKRFERSGAGLNEELPEAAQTIVLSLNEPQHDLQVQNIEQQVQGFNGENNSEISMGSIDIAMIEAEFKKLRFKPKQERVEIDEEKQLPQSEPMVIPTTLQFEREQNAAFVQNKRKVNYRIGPNHTSQPNLDKNSHLCYNSYQRKVEIVEEEKTVVTIKMLMDLYEDEQMKLLKDPKYPGGGQNPPYGPRLACPDHEPHNYVLQHNIDLHFLVQRMRYTTLLMHAMKELQRKQKTQN